VGRGCGENGGEEELVGKPDVKRPPGGPMLRKVDNIKMDLVHIRLGELDWIDLAKIDTSEELL
jgi:hypothetical protein